MNCSGDRKSDHLNPGLFEDRISNGQAMATAIKWVFEYDNLIIKWSVIRLVTLIADNLSLNLLPGE